MAHNDYIRKDLAGYWYNAKYMPDFSHNGSLYNGYRNNIEEVLFYEFAVQGYDMAFTYKGKRYYFLSEPDYVAFSDENFTEEYQRFEDGNTALEQFKIDGKSIVQIIEELEDVEAF
jgi:YHS domain-containing protein